ncbi:insulinase family protein [Crocinitomix algicola]|uniref:insulinase family protein n=1 Tax=Crocinitomix algicola TaxID=1740263 RepID=UPI0009F55451|nr:insulinase family protein [Crocinitomix algicola]
MKKFILIIAVIGLTFGSFAQIDRSKAPNPQPNPKIEINIPDPMKFENGLEVIMVENHKLPVVSFQLFIDYPNALENDKAGVSSIFGELLGSGTTNTPKDKFDEAIDYMGASFYPNSRGFYASSLKKHTPKLLNLLNEVITQPAFTQEEFDRIIEQNLSNLAALPSDANSMLSNVKDVVSYGESHPYGEIITEATLKNIKLEDVKNYYKKYFTPNKAYLVVVGDVSADDVKNYVEKYFGSWQPGENIEKSDFEVPTTTGKQVYFVDKPGAVQSVISVGHTVDLTPGHEDEIKLKMMNQILGGGSFSARLMSNLREDKAYTYGCYSNLSSDQLVGSFSAGGSFRNEVTDSAIVQILAEIDRMTKEPVSETELDLVKKSMTGAFARSLENPQTIARFALNTIRYNLPKTYYADYLQKLEKITASDILMVADKYISSNNINIIVVGNEEIAENLNVFDNDGNVDFKDYYGNKVDRLKTVPEGITLETIINDYAMKKMMVSTKDELASKIKSIQQIETFSKARIEAAMADIYVYEAEGFPNKTANYTLIKSVQGYSPVGSEWFNGEEGEAVQAGNKTIYEGEELEKKKASKFPIGQLKYLEENSTNAVLQGIKTIDGVDYYKVKVTVENKEDVSFEYYSVEDKVLVRTERIVVDEEGNEQTMQFVFSDYQEIGGLYVPKNMEMNAQGQVFNFVTQSVKTNKKAKAKAFSGNFKVAEKALKAL